MITHLETDILECEVKWPIENITMNKASGGDGFPGGNLFQNIPQFIVSHTIKDLGIVNKAEIDVFLELFAFSMIQHMLAI